MGLIELLRQLLYLITGRGPANVRVRGEDRPGVLKATKSGAVLFGVEVEPYFDNVEVDIVMPHTHFIMLDEATGEQWHGYGGLGVEVVGKTTLWVTAQECNCDRIEVTVKHGVLIKKALLKVERHGV